MMNKFKIEYLVSPSEPGSDCRWDLPPLSLISFFMCRSLLAIVTLSCLLLLEVPAWSLTIINKTDKTWKSGTISIGAFVEHAASRTRTSSPSISYPLEGFPLGPTNHLVVTASEIRGLIDLIQHHTPHDATTSLEMSVELINAQAAHSRVHVSVTGTLSELIQQYLESETPWIIDTGGPRGSYQIKFGSAA